MRSSVITAVMNAPVDPEFDLQLVSLSHDLAWPLFLSEVESDVDDPDSPLLGRIDEFRAAIAELSEGFEADEPTFYSLAEGEESSVEVGVEPAYSPTPVVLIATKPGTNECIAYSDPAFLPSRGAELEGADLAEQFELEKAVDMIRRATY
jgi:hypothetical protein